MSELVVAPPSAPLSKKERKRARKMTRGRDPGGGLNLKPEVTASVIESVATAGITKVYVKAKFDEIDADKKLTPEQRVDAKKKIAWQLTLGGLVIEQMTVGNIQRGGSGARSAGAAALGWIY